MATWYYFLYKETKKGVKMYLYHREPKISCGRHCQVYGCSFPTEAQAREYLDAKGADGSLSKFKIGSNFFY